jgi:hypothetical protein
MPNSIFVVEGLLLLVCFSAHTVVWRWRRPQNQAAALCAIFLLPLVAIAPLFLFSKKSDLLTQELFPILLLHFSLTSTYVLTYPALEGLSPSLACLLWIGKEPAGLTAAELRSRFDEAVLGDTKIQDLLESGLVSRSDGNLSLTARGKCFVWPFVLLRRLLGLPLGQG